jgi:hypothetical protein
MWEHNVQLIAINNLMVELLKIEPKDTIDPRLRQNQYQNLQTSKTLSLSQRGRDKDYKKELTHVRKIALEEHVRDVARTLLFSKEHLATVPQNRVTYYFCKGLLDHLPNTKPGPEAIALIMENLEIYFWKRTYEDPELVMITISSSFRTKWGTMWRS